jgi:hypothetical protein
MSITDQSAPIEAQHSAWHKPFRESAAIQVENLDVPPEFIEAQKHSIVSEARAEMDELPKWLRPLVEKNAGVEEIVETAFKRATRIGNHNTLVEVYAVLNDIGRDPRGSAEIQKHLTPENLSQLLRKE